MLGAERNEPGPVGSADAYYIRSGYEIRKDISYFVDTDDGITWQPDVYAYAGATAEEMNKDVIIDIGCGRAAKLAALAKEHPTWQYVGVDFGPNIEWCRETYNFGDWLEADLETTEMLPLSAEVIARSLVVCSDVLEHLMNPIPALALIRNLLKVGAGGAVLSTPARERRTDYDDPGPPDNPCHVREWASDEFRVLVEAAGLTVLYAGFTRVDDVCNCKTTQLLLVTA